MRFSLFPILGLATATFGMSACSKTGASSVRDAGTTGDLFSDRAPLAFEIQGDFKSAFAAARAGQPDGIFPRPRVKNPFAGTVAINGASTAAELKVRGNSSLQECAFPKLTAKLTGTVPAAFAGARKFKLGTHCGEESTVNGAEGFGTLTRKGFVLEHIDALAKRLGGKAIGDPEAYRDDPTGKLDPAVVVRIAYFHALIGNWDWGSSEKAEPRATTPASGTPRSSNSPMGACCRSLPISTWPPS